MKAYTKLIAVGMSVALTAGIVGCGSPSTAKTDASGSETTAKSSGVNSQDETHKIGVAVYNLTDDEVQMFRSYYEDYLADAFDVEFVYSETITSIDDEKEFVDQAKATGCEGIISYVSYDLPEITDYCADDLYYVIASGTFTEEDYEAASQHSHFLGITGPSADDEYNAGQNLIESIANEDSDVSATQKSWVLLNGGTESGNYMHEQRFLGALDKLQELGYTLEASEDELKSATENCLAATHPDGGTVYLCPGYYYSTDSQVNFTKAMEETDPDAVVSVCSLAIMYDTLEDKEVSQNKNIQIGAVDSFTETNNEAFEKEDSFGNSSIDCIIGKCSAMGAPAFIAMYNAVTGHEDVVKDNNQAYHLSQNMWIASSPEEYEEMYAKASNIYKNVYSTEEMMNVLGAYNSDASYEDYEAFVDEL